MAVGVLVRDATIDDADAVALVHVRAWQWAYRGLLPAAHLEALSPERRAEQWRFWLLDPGRTRTWLAETNDLPCVGFVAAGPSRDPRARADTGEIYALYVEERVAGTGVGTGLLRTGVAWLGEQGWTVATLWVLEGNARARRFYEREGWTLDGASKSEPVEDVVMDQVRYAIQLGGR